MGWPLSERNEGSYFSLQSTGETWIFLRDWRTGWHLTPKENWARQLDEYSTGGYPIGDERVDSYCLPLEFFMNEDKPTYK